MPVKAGRCLYREAGCRLLSDIQLRDRSLPGATPHGEPHCSLGRPKARCGEPCQVERSELEVGA